MYTILGKTRFPEPISMLTHQPIGGTIMWHFLQIAHFLTRAHRLSAPAGILIIAFKIE